MTLVNKDNNNMEIYLLVEPDKVPEYLICTICREVFDCPVRLNCTHSFCKGCIDTWIIDRKSCPECKKRVVKTKIGADLIASCLVNDIKVKCKKRTCIWEGRLEDHKNHLCKLID